MDKKACTRVPGWGVRPPNWNHENSGSSDSESESVEECVGVKDGAVLNKMEDKDFANWVSSKWNLTEFDGTKPVTERKNEWERFIEQFQRIIAVRNLSSPQKCQALKIQAGSHLNDVIKIQMQRGVVSAEESYEQVLEDLDSYFNQTCDSMQERSKFREMKMKAEEFFVDYELRCEKQLKHCNFSKEQADEELAEALIKRSVPEISKHLRLSAITLQNDIFAIIRQGSHLDQIRREEAENKAQQDELIKPVMAVQREYPQRFKNPRQSRFVPYNNRFKSENEKPRHWIPNSRGSGGTKRQEVCGKCSTVHEWGSCPAKGRICMKCKRWGHFARCCKAPTSSDRASSVDVEVKTINQVKTEHVKNLKDSSDEED